MTSGLQPSDLIIVAGRPSMGKTTFAMNLVENAVLRSDKVVLVYSLEMPGESLIMRMLSSLGRIDQTKVRAGRLEDDDWPRLTSAVNLLNDRKLFIDDTAGISPSEMRARTRRLVREHGEVALIMIDYLQLMQIPGSGGDNRTNEISEISRSLKALAKEFNCPVVALSQLNRSLEQRPNKRPINSDLRESGAIEQDADVIMFVYRDEVYHPETEHKGIAEIIIGKQRNGSYRHHAAGVSSVNTLASKTWRRAAITSTTRNCWGTLWISVAEADLSAIGRERLIECQSAALLKELGYEITTAAYSSTVSLQGVASCFLERFTINFRPLWSELDEFSCYLRS